MAADSDDFRESLADGSDLPDLRLCLGLHVETGRIRSLPGQPDLAAVVAAVVRHGDHRPDPALRAGRDEWPRQARVRPVPRRLLRRQAVAGRSVRWLGTRLYLEPPVVPGVPVGVHDRVGLAGKTA